MCIKYSTKKSLITIIIRNLTSQHAPIIPIIEIPAITAPIIIITMLAASKFIRLPPLCATIKYD